MTEDQLFQDPPKRTALRGPRMLNVRVSEASYDALKMRAATHGKTLSEATREALREWMAKHS